MQNLGTGEAVVSVLEENGAPSVAQHAYILPPSSSMGAITPEEREGFIKDSPLFTKYGSMVDSESAYEVLGRDKEKTKEESTEKPAETAADKTAEAAAEKPKNKSKKRPQAKGFSGGKARDGRSSGAPKQGKQSDLTKLKKSVASTTGSTVGREIGKVVGEAVLGKKGRTLGGNIGSTIGRNLLGTLAKR